MPLRPLLLALLGLLACSKEPAPPKVRASDAAARQPAAAPDAAAAATPAPDAAPAAAPDAAAAKPKPRRPDAGAVDAPVDAAPPKRATGRGQPCADDGTCPSGLTCIEYYGIAGTRGPEFTSCETPCADSPKSCPSGTTCTQISDGPGAVCR